MYVFRILGCRNESHRSAVIHRPTQKRIAKRLPIGGKRASPMRPTVDHIRRVDRAWMTRIGSLFDRAPGRFHLRDSYRPAGSDQIVEEALAPPTDER
jgi:hypothetical protein